jgi:hypothetical protein
MALDVSYVVRDSWFKLQSFLRYLLIITEMLQARVGRSENLVQTVIVQYLTACEAAGHRNCMAAWCHSLGGKPAVAGRTCRPLSYSSKIQVEGGAYAIFFHVG